MAAIVMFLEWLVRSATVGGLVLIALKTTFVSCAALAILALRPRAAASLRHLGAVAALAAVLFIPLASAWLPAWSLRVLPAAPVAPAARVAPRAEADVSEVIGEGPLVGVVRFPGGAGFRDRSAPANAVPLRAGPASSAAAGSTPPRWPFNGAQTALLFSLAVSAVLLARIAFGHVLARRLARGAEEIANGPLHARLEAVRARLGVRVRVSLRHTPRIAIPVVTGFRRPVLLVPEEAREWTTERAEAVFTHELAHVRRGDALALALAQVATALHWYQPLAWTLARAARRESERACDDVVLGCGIRATDYADHLFSIAARAAGPEPAAGAALAFARRSHLEGRLVAILAADAHRAPARARAIAAVTLATALLAGGLASVRVTRAESDGSHATATRAARKAAHAARTWETTASVRSAKSRTTSTTQATTETGTCTETHTECPTGTSAEAAPEVPATPDTPATPATSAWVPETSAELEASPASHAKSASSSRWKDSAESEGEEWFDTGAREYDAERFAAAAQAYRRAAAAGFRTETALYNAACSFSLAGMKREALEALSEALEEGFDDADQVSSDSDLDAIRGEPGFSAILDRALDTDSAREDRREAVERFEELRKEGSRADEDWRSVGVELLRAREFERALAAFDAAYKIDASPGDLYNKACVLALSGNAPKALETLRQSIERGEGSDPAEDSDLISLRRQPAFEELRRLSKDLQLYDGNIRDDVAASWRSELPRYERVAREHPALGRAWFNLAFAQLRTGDAAGAEASNKRALELGYRPATTMYNLACVAARRGEVEAALSWLDKSESAGMRVWEMAPGDRDLTRLRSDPRFLQRIDRWNRQFGAEKHAKQEYKREKRKT